MLELLAGYDSSSSSSSAVGAEAPRSPVHSSCNRHDTLLTRRSQDALRIDHPQGASAVGIGGHCSSNTACHDDGRASNESGSSTAKKQNPEIDVGVEINEEVSHTAKKRRTNPSSFVEVAKEQKCAASRVIIAGCNDKDNSDSTDQPMFERSHPHWGGRWVGHVHLPFPPLDLLEGGNDDENATVRINHDFGSEDSSSSSEEEEDDDITSQSRMFLPSARMLIHHWAKLLEEDAREESCNIAKDAKTGCFREGVESAIIIIPHIPMHTIKGSTESSNALLRLEKSLPPTSLHISLARPIYLPAHSVDPFLADIERSINAVISVARRVNSTNHHAGRVLHLQPQNATIFTNDEQTRSFLSIPVSKESARWVKQLLIPSIDAAMLRFGLETYYSTEDGEGCILHVSVASVKGNIIPHLLLCRNRGMGTHGIDKGAGRGEIRHISLFSQEEKDNKMSILESLPRCIPIRANKIECFFGTAKQLIIPI